MDRQLGRYSAKRVGVTDNAAAYGGEGWHGQPVPALEPVSEVMRMGEPKARSPALAQPFVPMISVPELNEPVAASPMSSKTKFEAPKRSTDAAVIVARRRRAETAAFPLVNLATSPEKRVIAAKEEEQEPHHAPNRNLNVLPTLEETSATVATPIPFVTPPLAYMTNACPTTPMVAPTPQAQTVSFASAEHHYHPDRHDRVLIVESEPVAPARPPPRSNTAVSPQTLTRWVYVLAALTLPHTSLLFLCGLYGLAMLTVVVAGISLYGRDVRRLLAPMSGISMILVSFAFGFEYIYVAEVVASKQCATRNGRYRQHCKTDTFAYDDLRRVVTGKNDAAKVQAIIGLTGMFVSLITLIAAMITCSRALSWKHRHRRDRTREHIV